MYLIRFLDLDFNYFQTKTQGYYGLIVFVQIFCQLIRLDLINFQYFNTTKRKKKL